MQHRPSCSRAWTQRLETSRAYYRDLIKEPAKAAEAFRSDFQTLRPLLQESRGRVLDVGGGNGLVRAFLPGIDQYVSIDPGADWLNADWRPLLQHFPGLPDRLDFVQGVGESLPFDDQSFDTVLLLFSLNHADDPARVVAETCRVLRAGGVALFALEDVEPSWSAVVHGQYKDWRGWSTWRLVAEKIRSRWRGWPLEPDHLPITEAAFRKWVPPAFVISHCQWQGSYLTMTVRPGVEVASRLKGPRA